MALALVALTSGSVSAQVVAYDSFGSANGGFDYDPTLGSTISGAASGHGNWGEGYEFSPSASGQLTQLIIALGYASGTSEADISIFADNGSNTITGSPIYTFFNAPLTTDSA